MAKQPLQDPVDFESVKARLAEIADAVDDEALPLDDALDLYEEAVALGLQASDLLETGIGEPQDDTPRGDGASPESADIAEPSGSAQSHEAGADRA